MLKKRQQIVKVHGEITYRTETGTYKSIMQPGKMLLNMNPLVVEKTNITNKVKKIDVDSLLNKHYGDMWRENESFFKNIIDISDKVYQNDIKGEVTCAPVADVPIYNI